VPTVCVRHVCQLRRQLCMYRVCRGGCRWLLRTPTHARVRQGLIANASGLSICTECAAGWYSVNQTACAPCAAGLYSNSAGSATCIMCPSVGASQSRGSVGLTIALRAQGTYGDAEGRSGCVACPSGTASSSPNATWCPLCAAGYYASGNGSVTCVPCAPVRLARF
jgi:hypothetical protein